MTKTQSQFVLPAVITAMMLTAFAFFAFTNNPQTVVASAPMYESNNGTTTSSSDASATESYVACLGQCQLASIVVTQPGTAGYVRIHDATTTATSTQIESSPFASSTYAVAVGRPIAQITGASDVAGTYQFDMKTYYGIVIETSVGFDGQYQVTWKQ